MRITGIDTTWLDYPDNESLAVIIYFSGCGHACPGCQNKKYQNYRNDESRSISLEELRNIILEECDRNRTDKVVFSGGDPLFELNRDEVIILIDNLKDCSNVDICVYTGYNIEDVKGFYESDSFKGFLRPDFFKCGKYLEEFKRPAWGKTNEKMDWATSNQNLYDGDFNLLSPAGQYIFA